MNFKSLLAPLGGVYGQIMQTRNGLYNQKILQSISLPKPIISVGNMTMGGTGKTPLVLWIANYLMEKGRLPGIISRGYGRSSNANHVDEKEIKKVNLENPLPAQVFGDEPTLMALKLPEVPIYVGKDRVTVAQCLLALEKNISCIIADDAFQHRRLKRHLDIVVIDGSQDPQVRHPFPWGMGREFWSGVKRADFCIINKINLSNPTWVQCWRELLHKQGHKSWAEAKYHLGLPYPVIGTGSFSEKKLHVICGIGNPNSFLMSLQQSFGVSLGKSFIFKDHQRYSKKNLDEIYLQIGEQPWITTEKDLVKLQKIKHPLLNYGWTVPVELHFNQGLKELQVALDLCSA